MLKILLMQNNEFQEFEMHVKYFFFFIIVVLYYFSKQKRKKIQQ